MYDKAYNEVAAATGRTVVEVVALVKSGEWVECPSCDYPCAKDYLTTTWDKEFNACEPCVDDYNDACASDAWSF